MSSRFNLRLSQISFSMPTDKVLGFCRRSLPNFGGQSREAGHLLRWKNIFSKKKANSRFTPNFSHILRNTFRVGLFPTLLSNDKLLSKVFLLFLWKHGFLPGCFQCPSHLSGATALCEAAGRKPTVGTFVLSPIIFAAYPHLALSSNVSFSNAYLCLPLSRCACNAEDRWNVLIQLSSGQLNIPLSCAITSSSSMPSVCWQEELKPLLLADTWSCLSLTTLKHDLWVCAGDSRTSNAQGELLSLWMSLHGKSFPGPIFYFKPSRVCLKHEMAKCWNAIKDKSQSCKITVPLKLKLLFHWNLHLLPNIFSRLILTNKGKIYNDKYQVTLDSSLSLLTRRPGYSWTKWWHFVLTSEENHLFISY